MGLSNQIRSNNRLWTAVSLDLSQIKLMGLIILIVILRMIKPVSLLSRYSSNMECDSSPPTHRERADSLVFSITSQKHLSGRDTNLLESREDGVSKQLETLQFKLESLENKVQHIQTDSLLTEFQDIRPQSIQEGQAYCLTFDRLPLRPLKENTNTSNRAGKIIKKEKSQSRCKAGGKGSSKSKVESNESRNSLESSLKSSKAQEVAKLRRLVDTMKQSIQKKERSKSICSERLSASKSLVRRLQREEGRKEAVIGKLRKDLKKSETIREKQKSIILRQQEEINHYRELLKLSKPIR